MTGYFLSAILSYSLFCLGIVYRKNKKLHMTLMQMGATLDYTLLVLIELNKSAIDTILNKSLSLFQSGHIFFSSLTLALYLVVVPLGWKVYFNPTHSKLIHWHHRLGWLTFFLRSLGFILMFSMMGADF